MNIVTWIATKFKGGPAGMNSPVIGYKAGPAYDHPAQQAIYVSRTGLPLYSAIGPGAPAGQPPGAAQPAYILLNGQSVRQQYSYIGPGAPAETSLQQALAMPPQSTQPGPGSTGEPNASNI